MDKQNHILTNLQSSTADTATALAGLATLTKAMSDNTSASSTTLLSLRSMTATMNKNQLSLFYDPSIALIYNMAQNRILLTNTGRTRLTVMSLKVNGQPQDFPGQKLISAGTSRYVDFAENYKKISSGLAKGTSLSLPVEAHLENEIKKHFVLSGNLFFVWNNDKVEVHGQNNSVLPEP
jgi:hypothetical protein